MKIGIDINQVLRDFESKLVAIYSGNYGFGSVIEPIDTYDLPKHFPFEFKVSEEKYLNENAPQYVTKYDLDSIKDNRVDAIDERHFEKKIEYSSADTEFKKFVYEEYVFELFGSSNLCLRNLDVHLNELIFKLKDSHEIYIVGTDEKYLTIPYTNQWLAKNSIKARYQIFPLKPEDAWKFVDAMITSNPYVLESKPFGKKSVKVNKAYNVNIEADISINTLMELTIENNLKDLI